MAMTRRVALFAGEPMTCIERINAMFAEYVVAAWVLGVLPHNLHARVRVRAAHCDYKLTEPYPEEWLLVEWPKGEKEPTKYWLSTLPDDISFYRLVDHAKLRWRIEHDYKELKQEVG